MRVIEPCCLHEDEGDKRMTSGRDYSIGRGSQKGYASDAEEYNSEDSTSQIDEGLVSRRPM